MWRILLFASSAPCIWFKSKPKFPSMNLVSSKNHVTSLLKSHLIPCYGCPCLCLSIERFPLPLQYLYLSMQCGWHAIGASLSIYTASMAFTICMVPLKTTSPNLKSIVPYISIRLSHLDWINNVISKKFGICFRVCQNHIRKDFPIFSHWNLKSFQKIGRKKKTVPSLHLCLCLWYLLKNA